MPFPTTMEEGVANCGEERDRIPASDVMLLVAPESKYQSWEGG